MKDLSALAPPFLMCAVVVVAIAAFVRHEMGRGRTDRSAATDESSAAMHEQAGEFDGNAGSGAETSAQASTDS